MFTKHSFTNFFYSLMKKAVMLTGTATIGASTTNTLFGRGFTSLTRTATGEYTLTLDSKYRQLRSFSVSLVRATAADFTFQIKSEAVATAGTIVFFALTNGVATNLTAADKLLIEVVLNDTDVI